MVVWKAWRGATTLLLLLLLCVVVSALRDSAQQSEEKPRSALIHNKFKPKTASRQTATTTTESSTTTKSSRRYGRQRADNSHKESIISNPKSDESSRSNDDQGRKIKTTEKSTSRRFSPNFASRNKKVDVESDPSKASEKSNSSLSHDVRRSRSGRKIQSTLSPKQLKSAISQSQQFTVTEGGTNKYNSETSTEAFRRPLGRSRKISRRSDTDESESVRVDTVESAISSYDVSEYSTRKSYPAPESAEFHFRKDSASGNAKTENKKPITTDREHHEVSSRKSSASRSRSSVRQTTTTEASDPENRRRSARSRNGSSRSSRPTTESIERTTEASNHKRRNERRNGVTPKPEEIKTRQSHSRSPEVNQRRKSRVRSGNYEEPKFTTLSNENDMSVTISSEASDALKTSTESSQIPMTLKSGRKESDGSARNRDRLNSERRRPAKEDFFNHGLGFRGRRPTDSPSTESNVTTPPITTSAPTTTAATTTVRAVQPGSRGYPGWTLKRRPGFSNEGSTEMNSATESITTTTTRSSNRGNARTTVGANEERTTTIKTGRRGNTNFAKGSKKSDDELQDDDNYPANFKARLSQLKNTKGAFSTQRTPVEDRKKISALFAARSRMKLENAQKLIKPELVIEDQDGTTSSDTLTVIPDSEVKATKKVEKFSDNVQRYSGQSAIKSPVRTSEINLKSKSRYSTKLLKSKKEHDREESTTVGKLTKESRKSHRTYSRAKDEENDVQSSSTKSPQKSRLSHRKHTTSDVARFLARNSNRKKFSTTEAPKTKISVMRGKITESTSRITVMPKKLYKKLSADDSSVDETPCDDTTEQQNTSYDDLITSATEVSSTDETTEFKSPLTRIAEQRKESILNVPVPIETYISTHQSSASLSNIDTDLTKKTVNENNANVSDFGNETVNEIFNAKMNLTKQHSGNREFFYPIFTPNVQVEKRPRTATYRRHSELPEKLFQPSAVPAIAITPKSVTTRHDNQALSPLLTQNSTNSVTVTNNTDSAVGISGNSNGESGTSNIFNPARSALLATGNSTLIEQIRSTVAPLLNSLGTKSPVFSGAYKNINGNSVGRIKPTAGSPRFTARYSGAEVFVRKPTFQATTPVITSSSKLFTPENSLSVDISSPGEPKVLTFYHAVETAGIVDRQTNIIRAKVNKVTDPNATNYPNNLTIIAKVEPIPPKSTSINFATNAPTSVGNVPTSTTTEPSLVPTEDQTETTTEVSASLTPDNVLNPDELENITSNSIPAPENTNVFNRISKTKDLSSDQVNDANIETDASTQSTFVTETNDIGSGTLEISTVSNENVSEDDDNDVPNFSSTGEVTTPNIPETESVTGSIVSSDGSLQVDAINESLSITESTTTMSTDSLGSIVYVNNTSISDVSNTMSNENVSYSDSVTEQTEQDSTEIETTTSNLASQIIYEILTQYRGPTTVNLLKEINDANNEITAADSTTPMSFETTNSSFESLSSNTEATVTESVPGTTEVADITKDETSESVLVPSTTQSSILDPLVIETAQPSTINPIHSTTTYAPDTDAETLINRLMKLAARIFPETLNIMQTLPSEVDAQNPLYNNQNFQAINEINKNESVQQIDDSSNENVTTTFLTTAPVETTTQIPDTTILTTSLNTNGEVPTSTINSNLDDANLLEATVNQTTDSPFTIPFQVTTPATAQTTAGMETQTDPIISSDPQVTTPIPTTFSPPDSVDDNLIIVDVSTSTLPPTQLTDQSNATTATATPTPTFTNNLSTQYIGRFGGTRITPAPKFSSSSSTTAPLRDYLVYGIYPNNTIVRKRPEDNLIDARNVDSPYVIFGIYPDGKLVRKFPNGTIIPDPPKNPVEIVFTLTTSTTTNRPRNTFFENRVQAEQVIRNPNGVLNIRKPNVGLDIRGDLFGSNDVDVGLTSNVIGPAGSTSINSMTDGSSASTITTLQKMTSTQPNAEIIPKVDFGSSPLVTGLNGYAQGGRLIQNRERDEATRTSEVEGQRGSVYTGQEKLVNYWTNQDQKSNPQVLGVKINSVTTSGNEGTSINVPTLNLKSNKESSSFLWKDPLDQIFGITTTYPTITASVSSNTLDETNTPKSRDQFSSLNPFIDIFSPSLSTLDTTASSTTVSTTLAETTTSPKSTTDGDTTTIADTTTTSAPSTTTETTPLSTTPTPTVSESTTQKTLTTTPVIITPESRSKTTTGIPVTATLTPLEDLTDPLAHVPNVNAFGSSFNDLAFLNGLLFAPGDTKTTSTMKTLTEVEQMLANKIISLAIGQTPGTPGPTRSPKAIQSESSNSINVDSYIKSLAALTSTTQATPSSVTTTTKPVTAFTWKPVLQNSARVKPVTPLTTTTSTSTTTTTTRKPKTTSTTTPKPIASTTRRTVLITAKPLTTTTRNKVTTPPPQGLGETLLRALFGGNFAPGSREIFNSNESSDFRRKPDVILQNSVKTGKTTSKPVQTTSKPVRTTSKSISSTTHKQEAQIPSANKFFADSTEQKFNLENDVSNTKILPVRSTTYSPEDDAKFLEALFKAAQTQRLKPKGTPNGHLNTEDEAFLQKLLQGDSSNSSFQKEKPIEIVNGNDAALIAALLKAQGIEPTTPANNLHQKLQSNAKTSTANPISQTTPRKPVTRKQRPTSAKSLSSTYPPPLFSNFGLGSSPQSVGENSVTTDGRGNLRNQVMNAALGITRAFSSFLSSAITGAAQQLQSFVNGTRYVSVTG